MDHASSVRERLVSAPDRVALVRLTNAGVAPVTSAFAAAQGRRRGSKTGAIIGAALGGLAGFYTAVAIAYSDCGGSCSGEGLMMGVALVGMPIAGAVIGSYLPWP